MDSYFSKATVYQMVSLHVDSASPDVQQLIEQAQGVWRTRIDDEAQSQAWSLIDDQAWYYWKQRRDDREVQRYPQLRVMPDPQLLAWINVKLGDYWTDRRLYQSIIREVNGELGFVAVEDLAPAAIRLSGGRVGAAFTRVGWEEHVAPLIDDVPDLIAANPLLKQAFETYDKDDLRAKLREFYVDEFRKSWRTFLESIVIDPFADLASAGEALNDFSQGNSPLLTILKKIYQHSQFGDLDDKEKRPIDKTFKPLGKFFGEGLSDEEKKASGDIAYVELMGEILAAAEGEMANLESMSKCHLRLKALREKISKRRRRITKLAGGSGAGMVRATAELLLQPLNLTQRAAIVDGCRCLDRVWNEQIYGQYWEVLQNQYPFSLGSADNAPMKEVISLFSNKLRDFHRTEAEPASNESVPLSSDYLSAYSVARQIGSVVSGSRVRLDFILRADSKLLRDLREMRFQIGRKRFDYAMGPAREEPFQWNPGAGDVRLVIIPRDRALQARPRSASGDWAMLRFFDEAEFDGRTASWAFPVGAGQNLYARYHVGGSDAGFITAGHFSQFKCPRTICR
jgi:type VI protein secretion system component VasK